MVENRVSALYDESTSVVEYLQSVGEYSFASTVDSASRKVLLMAAASFFEVHLQNAVKNFVIITIGADHPIAELVRRNVVERQYHTWFDWNSRNVNAFFSMFGDGFKRYMVKKVDTDDALRLSILAFLDIGSSRNALTHQNFGAFTLEKTTREIHDTYQRALPFVESFQAHLLDYCES